MSMGPTEKQAKDLASKLLRANSEVHFNFLVVASREAILGKQSLRDSAIVANARRHQRSAGEALVRHAEKRGDQSAAREIRRDFGLVASQ